MTERSPVESDERLRAIADEWGVTGLPAAALRHALTHSSAVTARSPLSNERLEFLGDAIVNAVVAEHLFRQFPEYTEGDLAKGRALVVSKVALYQVGTRMGLDGLIVLGANTDALFARSSRSLVADAVEAIFGTVYLHCGWDAVCGLILRLLDPELGQVRSRLDLRDPKTILQEHTQAQHSPGPVYRTIAEHGDAHSRTFTAEVTLHNGLTAQGSGRSKKDAQQEAAAAALRAEMGRDQAVAGGHEQG